MSYTDGYDRATRLTLGQIAGINSETLIGEVFGVPLMTDKIIWDGPDDYIFTDPSLYRINRISSSSSSDVGIPIIIQGLNEIWGESSQTAILNGQNKVTLDPELIRINRCFALADLNGDVYVYEDTAITNGIPDDLSKVKGYIALENNISKAIIFSTPYNKIAILKSVYPYGIPSQLCCIRIRLYYKTYNGAAIKIYETPMVSGGSTFIPLIPQTAVPVSAKTDIYASIYSSAPNSGISMIADWELIQITNPVINSF